MKAIKTVMIALALLAVGVWGEQDAIAPSVSLHVAALTGDMEAIRQHIEAGSDLNEKEPSRGSSPLITAAQETSGVVSVEVTLFQRQAAPDGERVIELPVDHLVCFIFYVAVFALPAVASGAGVRVGG